MDACEKDKVIVHARQAGIRQWVGAAGVVKMGSVQIP